MAEISKIVGDAVKEATDEMKREFDRAIMAIKTEVDALRIENSELKGKVRDMERAAEKNEQYNRKTSLILGGGGIPPPPADHIETTKETRDMATGIIRDKLGVNMQGPIVACHRLKNKKRIIVKFQDMEDREAVYQARFEQTQDSQNKIIVHENLTQTRANMIKQLGQMREKGFIVNYHTKNGMIYARNSRDKKYSQIEPWLSESEIMEVVMGAPNKGAVARDSFLRSQTLGNIPHGRVARQAADLSEFVINSSKRQTRSKSQTGQ